MGSGLRGRDEWTSLNSHQAPWRPNSGDPGGLRGRSAHSQPAATAAVRKAKGGRGVEGRGRRQGLASFRKKERELWQMYMLQTQLGLFRVFTEFLRGGRFKLNTLS
jgi:hypothetical protein